MGQFFLGLILSALPFSKYTLPNGLEVVLHQDRRLPIVAVNVMYHVGAFDEPRGRTGFAHLFEHLMYQGSRHVGDDEHMRLLTEAGAVSFNAFTSFDHTEYHQTVPANELELCLWLESDRMGYLLDTLDQARLDTQRDVVKNERRQNYDNTPYGLVWEPLLQALYPVGHPYHDGIIGSLDHLSRATLDDARSFFKTYYTPANATLVVSGDFDVATTQALITKYFGGLIGGPKPTKTPVGIPTKPAESRKVFDEPLGQSTRIIFAWVTPPAFGPAHAELDVVAEVLAGGKSSRLYRTLVLDEHVAQSVSADVQSLSGGSLFMLEATAYPDVPADKLEKVAVKALAQAMATPPTDAELRRVKALYETRQLLELESIGGDSGRANLLQSYNHYTGDPGYLDKDIAAHRAVDAAGAHQAATTYLADDRRLTFLAVPKPRTTPPPAEQPVELAMSNAAQGLDAAPWRARRPPSGPLPKPQLPVLQKATLPNGLTLLVGESHALPLVSLSVVMRAGAALDPPNKGGLAHFAVDLMDEGAAGRTAVQLDEALAELGCDAEHHVSRDGALYETVALKQHASAALRLLSDIVRQPTFDADELKDLRVRRIDHYYEIMADPTNLGLDRLVRVLTGSAHPYGHAPQGTPESLRAITRDDIVQFHRTYVTPERTAVFVVGDVTLAEARALVEPVFADWKRGSAVPAAPVPAAKPEGNAVAVRFPNATQTFVGLGVRTIPAGHADETALDMVSDLFGGAFNSRLNLRLREELAITYGAQSAHQQNRGGGVFVAFGSLHADPRIDGITESTRVWAALAQKPVTDAELNAAKTAYVRSLPGQFEHLEAIANAASVVFLHDLPLDYFRKKLAATETVTVKDARRVVDKYLRAPRVVVVGDEKKVKAPGFVWEDAPRKEGSK